MESNNYILIGSSSELSKNFVDISKNRNIYTVSSKKLSSNNHLHVQDYFDEVDKIISFSQEVENPTIVFFNGFLAENRPSQIPTIEDINQTVKINYLMPLFLSDILNSKINIKKFVYISSFAAIKPRNKNFIYAQSKKLLEKTIISMELNDYLFIRFGKINTKFSAGHKNSIFDLDVKSAAEALSKSIDTKNGIVYPNLLTKFLSIIFYALPTRIINKLKL